MEEPFAFLRKKPTKPGGGGGAGSTVPLDLTCPCCYRPGQAQSPLCGDCTPEEAAQKLAGLRSLMEAHAIDAYIVPSEDAHNSE